MTNISRRIVQLLSVVLAIIVASGSGCNKSSRPWDDKVPAVKKPTGLIRIIPIEPLVVGGSYPAGTLVSSVDQKLTLPSFAGDKTLWFAIELSGWGTSGLRGFSADIIRVDSICPRAPCGCMTSADSTSCTPGDCADGSECWSGVCRNAFINKESLDFVFHGLDHDPLVTESDPHYVFHIGVIGSDVVKNTGVPRIGGYLTISATDGCPDGPTTEVMFDSTSPPIFVMGDGSVVYPEYKGAHIFFEP